MPQKKKQPTKARNSSTTKTKSTKAVRKVQPINQYDNSRNLAISGIVGLVLFYILISRALNTGSYWEYFFGLAILIIAIRLLIRSIRLK